MDKWAICGHFYLYVDPVWSLYNIGPCCHVIVQVVFWVELLVQRRLCRFSVNHGSRKGDTMVWCRVTRHPRVFRGLTGCQRDPRDRGVTLDENEHMSKVPYSSIVGSMMYAMMCTLPNICHYVRLVFQYKPGPKHEMAVKRILRYLKGTSDYVLCNQGKDLFLVGYIDVDWEGDLDQRKSTSRYAFLLNDCTISWCSKKQSCITLSIMETKYVVCSSAI